MLNRHANKANLSCYVLIKLLEEQSQLVDLTIRLMSEKKMKLRQRIKFKQTQGKLFAAWKQYIWMVKRVPKICYKHVHILQIQSRIKHSMQ